MAEHTIERRARDIDGKGWLVALAVLCTLAVGLASLRHTDSVAFPIDDGYIYSNYVLAAAQGQQFTYNPGELSGGITGLGWYLLCTLSYFLLAPFHALLGGLGPPAFRHDPLVSQQAGHLYLAAQVMGAASLAATALGVRHLAGLTMPRQPGKEQLRDGYCWLLGAVAAADLGLVWGAMSGLEATFAAALAAWAVAALLGDVCRGRLRWSLVLAALLPWARPDLLAVGGACAAWLVLRAASGQADQRRIAAGHAVWYFLALGAGAVSLSITYLVGWGRPLPSSFYAKVGGLRLDERFFSAAQELLLAGRYLPFAVLGASVLGALLTWRVGRSIEHGERGEPREVRPSRRSSAPILILLALLAYVGAIMVSLPWFGQEDRYLLPVHPFAIVLCGLLAWLAVRRLSPNWVVRRSAKVAAATAIVAALSLANYWWATRNYAVEVRNIEDAHVRPAKWLSENTPPGSVVAAEPIGAVRLFSGRQTVDLVGLTSPVTLGTYGDWGRAWPVLREAGVSYLLFYPRWFRGGVPAWAVEAARFDIPDNKIAGDSVISIYRIDWQRYDASIAHVTSGIWQVNDSPIAAVRALAYSWK